MRTNRNGYAPVKRRLSFVPLALGCLIVLGAGVVIVSAALLILRPNVAGIAAQIAGFAASGDTAQVFAEVTPAPPIELLNATQPADIQLTLGDYGIRQLDPNSNLYEFTIGESSTGGQAAVASFSEAGLLDICRTQSPLCSDNPPDPRIRNPRIDLRPGGAVVYVDVTLPQFGNVTQNIGIVLRVDDSHRQLEFAGIDLNGALYAVPPEGFGTTITDMETRGNELLRDLSVQAGGGDYTLSEVVIDENQLTLVLR